jgi:hypothetical protein
MSLLRGLAYIGMFAAILLPTVGLALSGNSDQAAAAICLFFLVTLVVIVVALFIQTRWVVATPALVIEELGATRALGRSWDLTRGKFWRSFAVTFVLGLIALIVLSIPSFVIQMFAIGLAENLPLPSAIATFLGTAISALFVPLSASAYVVLYYDLRVRRESLDLEVRVGQLESELGTKEGPES